MCTSPSTPSRSTKTPKGIIPVTIPSDVLPIFISDNRFFLDSSLYVARASFSDRTNLFLSLSSSITFTLRVFPDKTFRDSFNSASLPAANFATSLAKWTLSKWERGINPLNPKLSHKRPPLLYSITVASIIRPFSKASSASCHFLSFSAFFRDKTI